MQRRDFFYELPQELIAQQPARQRSASRLLHLDRSIGDCVNRHFTDLPPLLNAGDLLVVNDTRVIRARLFGRKTSGGRIEILVERIERGTEALTQIRANKAPAVGAMLKLDDDATCEVLARTADGFYRLAFGEDVLKLLERIGRIPLPPYIARDDVEADAERYQTLFATKPGAVAAPTAALHFDQALIDELKSRGVEFATVTLHVGAGTFQPLRVDRLSDHQMHAEWIDVDQITCTRIHDLRRGGGRIIAVGTTVVRALESVVVDGEVQPASTFTRLFIKPGYRFQAVDAIITNFHLPESTLLVLVSAFAGRDRILAAYQHAITERYRFYSYGDAMLIT